VVSDIHDTPVELDPPQAPGQDPNAQIACIAPAERRSVERGAPSTHRMVGNLCSTQSKVCRGQGTHIDGRHPVRRGHRAHRRAVLP
jgi:hypothetical protein